MSARAITKAMGGTWQGGYGMIRCPCHRDRQPSCKVSDDPRKSDGVDVVCFAGCSWRDVKAALCKLGLIEEFHRETLGPVTSKSSTLEITEPDPDPEALAVWHSAIAIEDTPAERYLKEQRGLTGPFPPTLRYLPSALNPPTGLHVPAMVAGLARPDRKLIAVQVTYLTFDGRKASVSVPRRTIGKMGTGMVRLAPVETVMGVAEGVETALSAQELSGIPTWAVLGAKRLPRITIPTGVACIHIFADNDGPGLEAGRGAAEHYSRQGLRVSLRNPPAGFNDYNDIITQRRETLKQEKRECINN